MLAATRSWSPPALAAAESRDGAAAFTAVGERNEAHTAEPLDDAFDHWAVGGVEPDVLRIVDLDTQGDLSEWADGGGAAPGPFAVTETNLPDDPSSARPQAPRSPTCAAGPAGRHGTPVRCRSSTSTEAYPPVLHRCSSSTSSW